jgi:hypothetical protein
MTNGSSTGFLLLVLAAGLAGCSDSPSPSAPTTLSPAPQTAPAPTEYQRPAIRLQGVVSDTAFRPLAGARIEIVSGPETGAWITANAQGGFSFTSGTFDDTTQVRAQLDGYLAATQTVSRCVTCSNYYAFFSLAGLALPINIAGEYTLTFQADSACTDLPIEVRTRRYAAIVTPNNSDASIPSNTLFDAVVGGPSFLADYGGFWIGVAGGYLAFHLDGDGGPRLVEEFASNTYVAIGGLAAATVGPIFSTITAPFDGSIEYCERRSPIGSYPPCDFPVARAQCTSKNHRLTLTRR